MLTSTVFLNIEFFNLGLLNIVLILLISINTNTNTNIISIIRSLAGYRPWGHKGVRCELVTQ